MYQSAVAHPVMQFENEHAKAAMRKVNQRFVGFVWMSVWTMAVTGILMMLLSPRFIWFHFEDRWSVILGFKQVIFALMVFYAFGYARMLRYLDSPASNGGFSDKAELYRHRVSQFRKISVFLGIIALLLGASM